MVFLEIISYSVKGQNAIFVYRRTFVNKVKFSSQAFVFCTLPVSVKWISFHVWHLFYACFAVKSLSIDLMKVITVTFFLQWINWIADCIKETHEQLLFHDLSYFWNFGAGIECLLGMPELDELWAAVLQLNQRDVPGILSRLSGTPVSNSPIWHLGQKT